MSAHPRVLTHLPLDKMAAVSQTIFSDAWSWMKSFVFWLKFHWSLFLRVQLVKPPSIGLDNGLAPNRRQAIIGINADPANWRLYATLGGDELIAMHIRKAMWLMDTEDMHLLSSPHIQSSAIIMWSSIERYYTNDYRNWGRISIRYWIHVRHPITRPNWWAMWCLLWILWENWPQPNGPALCWVRNFHCFAFCIMIALITYHQTFDLLQHNHNAISHMNVATYTKFSYF